MAEFTQAKYGIRINEVFFSTMIEQKRISLLENELDKMRTRSDWKKDGQPESFCAGIQIVDIDHVALEIERTHDRFAYFFTPSEISYCQGRMASYAGRLAGKRAVMEILGEDVPWQDIAIETAASKTPLIQLGGQARNLADEKGIAAIPISISHDEGLAVAFVMGVKDTSSNLNLGTDISSVRRVARIHLKHGDHFLQSVFSQEEVSEAGGDPVKLTEKWAGKEAVAKVLGTGIWEEGVALRDINILTGSNSLPYIHLTGAALVQADKRALEKWTIGITSNPETLMAFVFGTS